LIVRVEDYTTKAEGALEIISNAPTPFAILFKIKRDREQIRGAPKFG
jgi:hypothetical protein